MTRWRWLIRAFRPAWRARFGEQLTGLLDEMEKEAGKIPAADRLDVARAGLTERLASVRPLSHHPRALVASGLVLLVAAAGALAAVESGSPNARTTMSTSTTSTMQPQVSNTGPSVQTAQRQAAAQAAAQQAAAEARATTQAAAAAALAAQVADEQAAAQATAQAATQSRSRAEAASGTGQ